jgi:beta-glucuronidase
MIAQQDLINNVYNRTYLSLNGKWNYIIDPYENGYYNYRYEPFDQMDIPSKSAFFLNSKPDGKTDLVEYDFDESPEINVPGDWNTQDEKLLYYEGTIWYKKSFDYLTKKNTRIFLYFGAVNYKAEVYLNGKKLGTHLGGFTPFNFEITDQLKEQNNFLIVKVDNKRLKDGVPTLNTDWWNYGGITRDVMLIETPENFIKDYFIQLNPQNKNQIKGFIKLDGNNTSNKKVYLNISDLNLTQDFVTGKDGIATFKIDVEKYKYWSTENPYLYKVILSTSEDTLVDNIGFRTIRTEGKYILLNNKKIFLKGISIHEERPNGGGRANSLEDAVQLLSWAKELGCNYVRLAHYPHNEYMVKTADKIGILVLEEIPVYWTIDWENESTYKNAETQLTEVINRDKNRASVIIWSMSNETPTGKSRNIFLTRLAKHTRNLDKTRLISAALEQSNYKGNPLIKTINDPFANVVDVLSFNEYIGWYDGLPDKCEKITWKITQNKPVLISEFGAGAKFGFHADSLTRWSEEYQEYLYKETLQMINKIDQLQGCTPWILMDFRSPRRQLPDIQDGWNRKGLLSEKGEKKKAYRILKNFYENKPVPSKN